MPRNRPERAQHVQLGQIEEMTVLGAIAEIGQQQDRPSNAKLPSHQAQRHGILESDSHAHDPRSGSPESPRRVGGVTRRQAPNIG